MSQGTTGSGKGRKEDASKGWEWGCLCLRAMRYLLPVHVGVACGTSAPQGEPASFILQAQEAGGGSQDAFYATKFCPVWEVGLGCLEAPSFPEL